MEQLREKALSLGATEFGESKTKSKKYYVIYNGKKINFGQKGYEDYTQHGADERRKRYLARATKIKNKRGELTANDKTSPNHWSINLLWDGK